MTHVQFFAKAAIPVTLADGEYDLVFTMVEGPEKKITAGPLRTTVRIPPPPLDAMDLKSLSTAALLREYVARGEAAWKAGAIGIAVRSWPACITRRG